MSGFTISAVLATQLLIPLPRAEAQASSVRSAAAPGRAALADPTLKFWKTHAPDTVMVDVATARGTIVLQLIRSWAPAGVDRFFNLARAGYYDDTRFYRVIYGFVAQFGIAANPATARLWSRQSLPVDVRREQNVRGTITFAQNKPTDRATNVFINTHDNPELDTLRFTPFGRVVQGMEVVDSLYSFYGDFPAADAPMGNPKRLSSETNRYLDEKFPKLDRILNITVRPDSVHKPN